MTKAIANDPRISLLHGAARVVADELGYDHGVELMIHFGGMQLSIPRRPMPRWQIWQKLGPETAKLLSRLYGGDKVEVPVANMLTRRQRIRAIAEHDGSHNETAHAFGVSRRWVKMVRRAKKQGPGPLFSVTAD